jgi:hypothetical protein
MPIDQSTAKQRALGALASTSQETLELVPVQLLSCPVYGFDSFGWL